MEFSNPNMYRECPQCQKLKKGGEGYGVVGGGAEQWHRCGSLSQRWGHLWLRQPCGAASGLLKWWGLYIPPSSLTASREGCDLCWHGSAEAIPEGADDIPSSWDSKTFSEGWPRNGDLTTHTTLPAPSSHLLRLAPSPLLHLQPLNTYHKHFMKLCHVILQKYYFPKLHWLLKAKNMSYVSWELF